MLTMAAATRPPICCTQFTPLIVTPCSPFVTKLRPSTRRERGLEHAAGDAAVIIDADLQDPPAVIPEMIERWRDGYDVVYGVRGVRAGETVFKTWTARAFYRLINRISEIEIPLDRRRLSLARQEGCGRLARNARADRFLRGMVSWIGFDKSRCFTIARSTRPAKVSTRL